MATTTTKLATRQAVQATFRKVRGFERSEQMTTGVRGYRKWSAGYRVTEYGNVVTVTHNTWNFVVDDSEKVKWMVQLYLSCLEKAGFVCEVSENGLYLKVTGRN